MLLLKRNFLSISTYYRDKLRNLGYLNRGIVFVLDLVLSSIGTLCALWLIGFIHGKNNIMESVGHIVVLSVIVSTLLFFLSKSYKTIIRFSTLRELNGIFFLLIIKCLLLSLVTIEQRILNIEYAIICGMLDFLISSFFMISYRVFIVNIYSLSRDNKPTNNVLVYGDSDYAALFASQINNNEDIPYRVVGILSRIHRKKGFKIAGLRVYTWDGDLDKFLLSIKQNITHIIFTNYTDFNIERNKLVYKCMEHNIQMLIGGEIHPLDKPNTQQIKNIDIEDLLQRDEIIIDVEAVSEEVSEKVVLVTGAAGSIGREISVQLARFGVKRLILLDIAETPLHNLELDMHKQFPNLDITFILSDIRSNTKIKNVFEQNKPDFVFHAAAYKHVPIIENCPCEGVLTNIGGTINIARHSQLNNVEKFIMISTDKAVNPTSVMGATKRIAEMCIQGLNNKTSYTKFITVRFGNVLGSNGSVIPLFRKQIASGGPVTVTHPEMIRYFMTIPEACRLVLQAATMGRSGEILIFDMGEQVKIDNLARKMILLSGLIPDEDIKIEYTGLRPGEKLYEELLTEVESTQMTKNKKIRIVQADKIDDKKLSVQVTKLMEYAKKIDAIGTVRMMKQIVPEFKSNNSDFEIFDGEELITYR
ncbi:polysaccharide biosynthesis protein [Dysgonomonas sp. Marseille-P4677]|uniref:polysaccharide biosynthesis protein n=1 Tax=Dysgonomonas sp. Marseille-P4677 TaxID=2364790 RepID=UPI001911D502|nr:nucleoside-diphosphate sugar epimerase/dehydratase [Dysgonomonas sp. Marseille-P4677]MBK5721489.1 polysaccharide biosynthesis protein [Dysgonomonas sp. Marseille-P4677]